MKLSRLPGRKNCERLKRRGEQWRGKTMNIRWMQGAPRHPLIDPQKHAFYVGTITSTKLHKSAVKRNRMRRRCREALRSALQEQNNLPTVQLLLQPKGGSLECSYSDIESDVASFLSLLA